jgi:hypothetical protein
MTVSANETRAMFSLVGFVGQFVRPVHESAIRAP